METLNRTEEDVKPQDAQPVPEPNNLELEPVEIDSEQEASELYFDDEKTWREKFPPVDEITLKGRKYGSDFSAALKSIARAEEWSDSDIATALTLMDAARRADRPLSPDVDPSSERRFPCAAWLLELYFRRETLPEFGSEEERHRFEASCGRAWRRRWESLHDKQCRTHHGFFVKHDPEESKDRKLKACSYTDRLTDTLNLIVTRARKMRGRSAVEKFERARSEVIAEFVAKHPVYAPDWTEPEAEESSIEKEEKKDDLKKIRGLADKFVKRCRDFAREQGMTEDEEFEFRRLLMEHIESKWTDGPSPNLPPTGGGGGERNSSVLPVSYMADKQKSGAASGAELRARASEANCENAGENKEKRQNHADRFVLVKSAPEAPPIDQANQTVAAFESVGVTEFKTVFLSCVPIGGDARCVGSEEVKASDISARLSGYIRRSERQEQSICLRPRDGRLIQVDDCSSEIVERLAPYSFLTVETSTGNYQVWIALPITLSDDERKETRERLLRKFKESGETANGGAYNSVRLPGALNAKEKYRARLGNYPRVRLAACAPGLVIAPQLLGQAGLLAEPLPPKVIEISAYSNATLPTREADYFEYLRRAGKADSYKPDRSNADICYAIVMLKMGWPRYHIAARINELSGKAKGRRDSYAEKTVDAAGHILSLETPITQPRRRAAASGRVRVTV